MSCVNDAFAWSVNYEALASDHPFIKDTWQQLDTPYDFNSIMQYDGTICQIGSKPVIAYKSNPTKPVIPNSRRMTSLDVISLNKKYKCGAINPAYMETQPCKSSNKAHRAFFIKGHQCDGYKDCDDGSDEKDCGSFVPDGAAKPTQKTTQKPTQNFVEPTRPPKATKTTTAVGK